MTRRVLRPRAHFQSFSNAQARAGTVIAMTSWWLAALLLLATPLFAGVVRADVALRVEAIPIADPIQGFVTVTDANGDPVGGLDVNDFTVTLDGTPITIPPGDFTLPPADPGLQRERPGRCAGRHAASRNNFHQHDEQWRLRGYRQI
jgi:hypothetical protein